jgi:rRNA maturation endonuclease Nob1
MKIVLLAIGFMAIAFAGIAIKLLVKKNGKFEGTCASNNPLLNKEGEACGLCGASPEEKCKSDDKQAA